MPLSKSVESGGLGGGDSVGRGGYEVAPGGGGGGAMPDNVW